MSRWGYWYLAVGIAILWLLLVHLHDDISAIQIRLDMLDAAGHILPEYQPWW